MKHAHMRKSLVWMAMSAACAFTPPLPQWTSTASRSIIPQQQHALGAVIRADELDFDAIDPGAGGVRLAQESAIKVTGTITHKPGSADAQAAELLRYTKLCDVSEATANNMKGVRVVCTGLGTELYRDPGETTVKEVTLAPLGAVRDATMNALGSAQDAEKLVINFLGGDELQMLEVLDAVQQMVINLDVKTKAKISFNSLSHSSYPVDKASITVVAVAEGDEGPLVGGMSGAEKSVAQGEFYWKKDGTYVTVAAEDITDAVA